MRVIFWLAAFLVVCQLTMAKDYSSKYLAVPIKKSQPLRGPAGSLVKPEKRNINYSPASPGIFVAPARTQDRSESSRQVWNPQVLRF